MAECCSDQQKLKSIRCHIQSQMNGLDDSTDKVDQLGTLRQADEQRIGQAVRMNNLQEFKKQQETKFTRYNDTIARKFVEQITPLDAETIRIKFRYPGLEVGKSLNG